MDKLRLFVWRRSTTITLTVGVVLIMVALVASFVAANFKPTTQVRVAGGVYSLQLANTVTTRFQGLSDVEKIQSNGGLLMVFDSNDMHGIWMKDMKFPLDLVWLDSSKKVVYIVKNAPPENPANTVYVPKDPALYVLELPAGSVQKAGIKTGDTAEFKLAV
jgi:hypothetical protein